MGLKQTFDRLRYIATGETGDPRRTGFSASSNQVLGIPDEFAVADIWVSAMKEKTRRDQKVAPETRMVYLESVGFENDGRGLSAPEEARYTILTNILQPNIKVEDLREFSMKDVVATMEWASQFGEKGGRVTPEQTTRDLKYIMSKLGRHEKSISRKRRDEIIHILRMEQDYDYMVMKMVTALEPGGKATAVSQAVRAEVYGGTGKQYSREEINQIIAKAARGK